MVKINEKAPEFSLPDQNGQIRTLQSFSGKKTVIYFYSKDNTSGCTAQALGYAALYGKFTEAGAEVVGVSRDTVQSHVKFKEKHGLPFVLLSDPDMEMIKAYGVYGEKKLYGKTSFGTVRSTFIIDENGTVVSARTKVNSKTDPDETLRILLSLETK
ncbi:MAG: peroxiredoxin [Clostridia bacterium]|nr:peroxiredoxin [Clostridia bacterium]